MDQPLFISVKYIKNKQENTSEERITYLIPELCKICGISEDMKQNRNFMKDLA
jgi:hypothetical protein